MELLPGVYETLITAAIEEKLSYLAAKDFFVKKEDIDSAESSKLLSQYLAGVVSRILKDYFISADGNTATVAGQVEVVNRVLNFIESEWALDDFVSSDYSISPHSETKLLRGIYKRAGFTDKQIEEKSKVHPKSGYRVSNLFTGGNNELTMVDEVRRDIQTADSIDLIVSFIKFEGIRLLIDDLRDFVKSHRGPLRIITTTYMGATDPKALAMLMDLGKLGDVQIKVTFNNNQERLHAKAYIFSRKSTYDTAYIGSSNISRSALTKGLEWNMRVTAQENPHILAKTKATFDNYWCSDEFETMSTREDLERFEKAINVHHRGDPKEPIARFIRKDHQIKVLEKLQFERETIGSRKNLIIAATGTGKTAISAFDFKDFNARMLNEQGREARLLFVVHREKILKQALSTFRSVMVDANFGEIWTGRIQPSVSGNLNHLFITIQTLRNNWDTIERMGREFYDYIVIDEVHHSQAGSYREIFSRLNPQLLIGLTATPERMDGQEIKPDFNNRFAAEIRLQEALNQELLVPFDYFCVTDDDSVDLSNVACHGEKYDVASLNLKYVGNRQRFALILGALGKYVANPMECKAICFCCSVDHANYMAQMFNEHKYKALAVTSRNSEEIDEASARLARGDIHYLCVVDMLNEGIDIPEIDTVLFLRPTESLTVFLQQLGRGLRLADGKESLTVLDFIAQANNKFNYESRFRALVGSSKRSIRKEIEGGFTFLPRGCSITMERKAQEYILKNIDAAIFNRNRLVREVKNFTENTGLPLTIKNFLENFGLDWGLIYKRPGSWSRLLTLAQIEVDGFDPDSRMTKNLEAALPRLRHINSLKYLRFISDLIDSNMRETPKDENERKFLHMFYFTVFFESIEKLRTKYGSSFNSMDEAVAWLGTQKWFIDELSYLVEMRLSKLDTTTRTLSLDANTEIELYGCYTADEIRILMEGKEYGRTIVLGTQYDRDKKIAKVFVTLNKSDKEYSPSTCYEDYAISQSQFHWQSMNRVRPDSTEGQRIINQRNNGWRYILFVRDSKKDEFGNTNAYYCLGLMDFERYHGECPMNVVWNMQSLIPGFLLETAKAV